VDQSTHISNSFDRHLSCDVQSARGILSIQYHLRYVTMCVLGLVQFTDVPSVVWGFLVFLSALVLRQHFMGHRSMWYCAVTSYPWFGKGKGSGLPNPVASRSRSRGRSFGEKDGVYRARKGDRYSVWKPRSHRAPVHAHLATDKYDKYKRGASPRR
jgi:hypothetical protein